jgi:hypothetical protein
MDVCDGQETIKSWLEFHTSKVFFGQILSFFQQKNWKFFCSNVTLKKKILFFWKKSPIFRDLKIEKQIEF